jgi:hypothetical protein
MQSDESQPVSSKPEVRWYQCRPRTLLFTGLFVALVLVLLQLNTWYEQWGSAHLEEILSIVVYGRFFRRRLGGYKFRQ